jgi:hypothetical protein
MDYERTKEEAQVAIEAIEHWKTSYGANTLTFSQDSLDIDLAETVELHLRIARVNAMLKEHEIYRCELSKRGGQDSFRLHCETRAHRCPQVPPGEPTQAQREELAAIREKIKERRDLYMDQIVSTS